MHLGFTPDDSIQVLDLLSHRLLLARGRLAETLW
jgi:hypothetical protein